MGSKSLKKILPIAAVVAAPMIAPALFGGTAVAGSTAAGTGLGSLLSGGLGKKFLMNQLITAGLSKATTGKIDPKAQLMAGLMSGMSGMGTNATAAEKAFAASKPMVNPTGTIAKTFKGTNPLAAQMRALDPLTRSANLSSLGSPGAVSSATNKAFTNFLSQAPASQQAGQTLANLGRNQYGGITSFLREGYANPLSLKGAVAYGAPTATAALADAMKTKGTSNDPTAKENEQAQAFYDSATAMNEAMGGTDGAGYDTDTFNKLVGGYLSTMPGNYEKLSGDKATAADDGRVYAQLYPELNYSGLNTFTSNPDRFKKLMGPYNPYVFADGGSVMVNDDPLTRELFGEMMGAQMSDNEPDIETLQGIKDYIDHLNEMDAVKAAMEEQVPNPVGRANGGIMNSGSIPQTSNVPNGMQVDGRGGGFIPMGAQERKDDVPAMLAKNEFVMTADAVRAAGGGSINKGAQKMYDLMNSLEAKA